MRVIFVCSGNTCRSPFAEGYLKSLMIKGVDISSRGLSAPGMPVSRASAAVASEYGFDISEHLSVPFSVDDLGADRMIAMSDGIKNALLLAGADPGRTFTLAGGIPDPFGGDIGVYRECLKMIAGGIDRLAFDGFFDGISVVAMRDGHIPFIAATEKENFSQPWSEKSILESSRRNTVFFVAEADSVPLGYIGLNFCADEGYITSIAVSKEYRRKGVASRLMGRVLSFAREKELAFVSLEVRPSNANALSLYEKFGFLQEGLRKRFYTDPTEDALIMTRRFKKIC